MSIVFSKLFLKGLIMINILISIKRPYSANILSGKKVWELRKTAPRISRGEHATLWMYESGKDGQRAIVGKCRMVSIVPLRHMPFGYPLASFLSESCVTKEHLIDYLPCCAWGVCDPVNLALVPLSVISLNRPPQSWQYLTDEQAAILEQEGGL